MLIGFATAALAMTQGEFQPGTRRGLFSLVVVLLILALLFATGKNFTHLSLPPGS